MKTPTTVIAQVDVLAWLKQNHPALHAKAELDRSWCWLSADLRGETNKPVRESLKAFGFKFAKRGHALPSGATAFWGHHCDKPIPFIRKNHTPAGARPQRGDLVNEIDALLGVAS